MSRKSKFRFLIKSSVFFLAVLAIVRLLQLKKKHFFNYKIDQSLLGYCSMPGFDKIVFTYTELTIGSDSYYSLEANVFDITGGIMNGDPIKLQKHGLSKALKNSTPDYRVITHTLTSGTLKSNDVDLDGNYILSADQTLYEGRLYVSYIFDIKEHFSISTRRFMRTAHQASGTPEYLVAAAQTSFTSFKINPSPPY